MKSYHRLMAGALLLFLLLIAGANAWLFSVGQVGGGRGYRVEISHLAQEIAAHGLSAVDFSQYHEVRRVVPLEPGADREAFFDATNLDYAVRDIGGTLYRFDYEASMSNTYRGLALGVNTCLLLAAAAVFILLFFIRSRLIKPFDAIREVPFELSKGNLTVGLKENKSRFFGRFVWGLDLLRESLEQQRKKELALQKEKKTLLLTISHDIKTPLSAIKLYAKALTKNLYGPEKQPEIVESIHRKTDEIEAFVSQIIKASSEDFLNLEVERGEFYLQSLMEPVQNYYTEKLGLLQTDFRISPYENCLLKGDENRAVEVLQNLMENAVKYGDGRRIRIAVSREEDCLLITVVNSGCTLSGNELLYIFDSFWRGSNTGNSSGSGLGLYICRQLMQKMDGDVFAECEHGEMRVTAVFRRI